MRVVIVTKPAQDYSSAVDLYLRDIKYQTGHDLDIVNPDTPDGAQFCRVYDIVEYPTIIVISNDGVMQNMWRGLPMPTISEISYYFQ